MLLSFVVYLSVHVDVCVNINLHDNALYIQREIETNIVNKQVIRNSIKVQQGDEAVEDSLSAISVLSYVASRKTL